MANHRIVSLLPSATEIVCALACETDLVGRSHECDYPATVSLLPICSEPAIDIDGSSNAIDERVKRSVRDAISIYKVNCDLLRTLKPTVLITQTQCEVCAVNHSDVEAAVREITDSNPQIISLEPKNLIEIYQSITDVGQLLDLGTVAEEYVGTMMGEIIATGMKVEQAKVETRPRVACIEWIDPLMAAGNWVPELVVLAGGTNLFGSVGEHSPFMEFGDLVASDPDVIVVMPCGFNIDRSRSEMPALTNRPEWSELTAVKNNQVYLTDGNQYFNRPGPRIRDSVKILAEILHPTIFPAAYEGIGWERF